MMLSILVIVLILFVVIDTICCYWCDCVSLLLLSTTIVTDLADGLFDPYIYIYYNYILKYIIYIYII
nr:MAG TPA: hypothetical protein [Crassvirales sp.]